MKIYNYKEGAAVFVDGEKVFLTNEEEEILKISKIYFEKFGHTFFTDVEQEALSQFGSQSEQIINEDDDVVIRFPSLVARKNVIENTEYSVVAEKTATKFGDIAIVKVRVFDRETMYLVSSKKPDSIIIESEDMFNNFMEQINSL